MAIMTQISKSSSHLKCNVDRWTCLIGGGVFERNCGALDEESRIILYFPKSSPPPPSINNDDPPW